MTAPTQPPPDVPRPVMTGLTWQEFLDLPEEYRHADLINGDLFVSAPTPPHQRVVSRLVIALGNWTAAREGRGEVTIEPAVQIRHDRGYMPDVAWWREDKCSPPDHTSDVFAEEELRSPLLEGFAVRLGDLTRR